MEGENVEAINLAGQVLLSETAQDNLDLSNLPTGLYLLRCGAVSRALLKNRVLTFEERFQLLQISICCFFLVLLWPL